MHILAVEPDRIDRLILKRSLSPYFFITTLSSGDEAIRFAATQKFDVLVVNRTLVNDLDAVFLLRALRQQTNEFPAIATTAIADPERDALLLKAGFYAVITKPVTFETFFRTLKYSIDLRSRNGNMVVTVQ